MQRSFDDLGTPLADVTFSVLDIETTGSDRANDLITEIGVVKVRAGQVLGTLATLLNPGAAIPPLITVLTGITDSMVVAAPRIEQVLPSLVEFLRGTVVVGHNVGFDLAFINAALMRRESPRLDHPVVDTLPLARRLLRDEVPDCRLGTLANRFRLDHRPTHRAFADALATTDLLHFLLERAAGLGVLGLDDLLLLPRIGAHPQVAKLRLTDALPRSPGVYLFHGLHDEVLYVGKATNLRQRVRSYFSSDDRRKIGPLLRETQRVSHTTTLDPVSAEVLEMRYLHAIAPRYNRVGTTWRRYCYVRLTTGEAWPRFTIVHEPGPNGVHLGPLPSKAVATQVVEALQSVLPLRRCSARLAANHTATFDASPCSAAQLGVAMCPCAGHADPVQYRRVVAAAVAAITHSPHLVLEPLRARLESLAGERRYEEAALLRDRANAFTGAIRRQRLADQLRAAGDAGVQLGDTVLHVRDGVLAAVQGNGRFPEPLPLPAPQVPAAPAPLPRHAADEVLCLARAIDRTAGQARLLWCEGEWAWPAQPLAEITRLRAA